jgi:hypothetical protein
MQIESADSISQHKLGTKPYPPSFIDRFIQLMARQPVHYGLLYLAFFVLESFLNHIISWIDGWVPAFTFNSIILTFPLWLWGPLAIITYLNSISRQAVSEFAPLLNKPPEAIEELQYEFTTMPRKGVLISAMFWGIWYLGLAYVMLDGYYRANKVGTFATTLLVLEGFITFLIGSVIYYHTFRQLRLVDKTVKMVKQFNLFHMEPAYAFSIVTSRTGIAWAILLTFTLLNLPLQIAIGATVFVLVLQIMLVTAAFVLPLRRVNQRLVAEKRRLEAEHSGRVEEVLAQLHLHLDNKSFADMPELNASLAGLNAEREILNKIPTWPWRAGLLTGFLSVVVIPIVLFLIQLVIQRFVGK